MSSSYVKIVNENLMEVFSPDLQKEKVTEWDIDNNRDYPVPFSLLKQYAIKMKEMEKIREITVCDPHNPHAVNFYKSCDTERQVLHDKILKVAEVDREDTSFEFWLASKMDRLVAQMETKEGKGNRAEKKIRKQYERIILKIEKLMETKECEG